MIISLSLLTAAIPTSYAASADLKPATSAQFAWDDDGGWGGHHHHHHNDWDNGWHHHHHHDWDNGWGGHHHHHHNWDGDWGDD